MAIYYSSFGILILVQVPLYDFTVEVPVKGVWERKALVSTGEEGVRVGGRAVGSEQRRPASLP